MENMNIYQKLQKCRVELQRMSLKKSGKNTFAGFEYFELSDFLPAVNDLFEKYGLYSRFGIADNTATLTVINAEKPEETETYTSPIADANLKGCTPIQSLGGVHTYMKRYLYVNALEITDGDIFNPHVDGDILKTLSPEILSECAALDIDINNVAAYFKKPVDALTDTEVRECIERKKRAKK